MKTPVFCLQVNDICNSTLWAFADFNYFLKRLGFLAGYTQELSGYALCRGAANAVDCTVILGKVKRDRSLLIPPRTTYCRSLGVDFNQVPTSLFQQTLRQDPGLHALAVACSEDKIPHYQLHPFQVKEA